MYLIIAVGFTKAFRIIAEQGNMPESFYNANQILHRYPIVSYIVSSVSAFGSWIRFTYARMMHQCFFLIDVLYLHILTVYLIMYLRRQYISRILSERII